MPRMPYYEMRQSKLNFDIYIMYLQSQLALPYEVVVLGIPVAAPYHPL